MKKVLVTEPIDERAMDLLRAHFRVVQGNGGRVVDEAQGCDGILLRVAEVREADMAQLPDLKVVAKHGIGLDSIDVDAATARGIAVVNAPLSNINAVAEHTATMVLALSKQLVHLDQVTRHGGFPTRTQYKNLELKGATVGLVGLGKIARLVAQKLSGFGVHLIGYDLYVKQEQVLEYGIQMTDLSAVLSQSDFICLHTPLTPETRHMISTEQLTQMKPTAYLINTSRGPVVDEAALVKALKDGTIAGAALDVFEQEPPAADDPLFQMDQVILSPHNAALTKEALLAMAMDSAQGIVDYLEGRTPQYLCNPQILQSKTN